jgi:class 3 adenylate cyclase
MSRGLRFNFFKSSAMQLRRLMVLVLGLAMLLLLGLLGLQSQAIDVDQHNRYSNALVELSEVDARLNQAILQVRYGLLNNYDTLVQAIAEQKRLDRKLQQPPRFIDAQGQQQLIQRVQAHLQTLQQKEQQLETFKSYNAILKNSLAYFPIAITELVTKTDEPLDAALSALLRDVLIYNLSDNTTLHDTIEAQIVAITRLQSKLPPAVKLELKNAIAHARIILNRKSQVYELVSAILTMPMLERIGSISEVYNQYYQAALNRVNNYRFWLYLFSIILVAGIATIIILKLRGAAEIIQQEQERAEKLLLNILPQPIAQQLKQRPQCIAESFPEVTVLFADIVGFTQLAGKIPPTTLVNLLNTIFSAFDRLTEHYGLEKIKTIGDAYMVVGGLPMARADHAEAIASMALDMQAEIARFNTQHNEDFKMRIGINTGPVVAGVIGIKKFIYDLWGDTVNIASRMESQGVAGCIQVSEATYLQLQHTFVFGKRRTVSIKGKGNMTTYLLLGKVRRE